MPLDLAAPLTTLVLAWEACKDWLSATLHLPHLALHAVVGVLIPPAVLLATRRPASSLLPLAVVALLEAANEALDFARYALAGWPWQARATATEALVTVAPALALILLARLTTGRSQTA